MKIILKFFRTERGKVPFDEWAQTLEHGDCKKIYSFFYKVIKGNTGLLKSLSKGLFEIKLSFGPGYRIYCLYSSKNRLLILNGGTKRTQSKDIKKAREYQKIYKKRGKQNGRAINTLRSTTLQTFEDSR